MDLLDCFPNALAKLKHILASLVMPIATHKGEIVELVDPLSYKSAQTVRELFRLMGPYWNCLSADLLILLLEASGCNQAASKVLEFVEARASKTHEVLCIRQQPTFASGGRRLRELCGLYRDFLPCSHRGSACGGVQFRRRNQVGIMSSYSCLLVHCLQLDPGSSYSKR